mgnify:CR=1 FL=1
MIGLPSFKGLPIAPLEGAFNNVTNSYKFYWFLAILEQAKSTSTGILSINELLAQMVASVWYPVHYYRLSFGKQDRLGLVVNHLKNVDRSLDASSKPGVIFESALRQIWSQSRLGRDIKSLGNYVPHRFLRPFFDTQLRGRPDSMVNGLIEKLAEAAFPDELSPCLYRFVSEPTDSIELHPLWLEYLRQHVKILAGFTLWHLTRYLQRNNPNVPNVSGKLFRPEQRDLRAARAFWNLAIERLGEVRCIYSKVLVSREEFSLDHFLPWSFVCHDLLWNIVPTAQWINSAKGDQVPDLTEYFEPFSELQYTALQAVVQTRNLKILEDYITLLKGGADRQLHKLSYHEFRQSLFDTIAPQVQIARNMGFGADWRYQERECFGDKKSQ